MILPLEDASLSRRAFKRTAGGWVKIVGSSTMPTTGRSSVSTRFATDSGLYRSDPQGEVLNQAREVAREHLRVGQDFIWNSANLSRNIRGECLRLFNGFDAHLRIVYIEVPADQLFAQNRLRRRRVPERVIERLLDRWEIPDRTEAHQVDYVVRRNRRPGVNAA